MTYLVGLVGLAIVLFAGLGVFAPGRLMGVLGAGSSRGRLWLAIGIRVVLGAVFLIAAPQCRNPLVMRVLGIVALIAAAALPFLGAERLDGMVKWWGARSNAVTRTWAVVALAFGAFLIYTAQIV